MAECLSCIPGTFCPTDCGEEGCSTFSEACGDGDDGTECEGTEVPASCPQGPLASSRAPSVLLDP